MRTEIETMRRLDHPNVVRLFETLEDAENVFLLMELCHGGRLQFASVYLGEKLKGMNVKGKIIGDYF